MGTLGDFADIAGAAWEASKTPLDRIYDAVWPGWDNDRPFEFPTVSLVDRRAGQPVACSACGHSDLWAVTEHGTFRCAGPHEPMWAGRGYIDQVIEVNPDEVTIKG